MARARMLTVLRRLDRDRKGVLLRFLYEADLIHKDKAVINLIEADLSGAKLSNADLMGAKYNQDTKTDIDLSAAGAKLIKE